MALETSDLVGKGMTRKLAGDYNNGPCKISVEAERAHG
jgi:hypothetical protein